MADDSKQFLDEVKKGKPRKWVMICKGVKIVSLVVYKKGTLEKYKKQAKKEGKGKFFHGVVDGKGVNLSFKLCEDDGYDAPPGKELVLKDFLKTEFGIACKPTYEIVATLPEVQEADDDDDSEVTVDSTSPIDASDLEAELKRLAPAIKTFLAEKPDQRVAVLKPTKVVKDYTLDPENHDRQTAEEALAALKRLLGESSGGESSSSSTDTTPDLAAQLKELSVGIKEFVADHPTRKIEILTPVKVVKSFTENEEGTLEGAVNALNSIRKLLGEDSPSENDADSTTSDTDRAKRLAARLKASKPAVDSIIESNAEHQKVLHAAMKRIAEKIKSQQFDDAENELDKFEKVLKSLASKDPKRPPTDDSAAQEAWRERSDELEPLLLQAQAADRSKATRLGTIWDFAHEQHEAGNFKRALSALDKLEAEANEAIESAPVDDAERLGIERGIVADQRARLEDFFRKRVDQAKSETKTEIDKLASVLSQVPDEEPEELTEAIVSALDDLYEDASDAFSSSLSKSDSPDEILKTIEEWQSQVAENELVLHLQTAKAKVGADTNVVDKFNKLFTDAASEVSATTTL